REPLEGDAGPNGLHGVALLQVVEREPRPVWPTRVVVPPPSPQGRTRNAPREARATSVELLTTLEGWQRGGDSRPGPGEMGGRGGGEKRRRAPARTSWFGWGGGGRWGGGGGSGAGPRAFPGWGGVGGRGGPPALYAGGGRRGGGPPRGGGPRGGGPPGPPPP